MKFLTDFFLGEMHKVYLLQIAFQCLVSICKSIAHFGCFTEAALQI